MTTERAIDPGRARYLDETTALLWPPPAQVTVGRPGRGAAAGSALIVLPGRDRPRLVVPAGRRAAAAAVRRYGEPGSRTARLATRSIGLAMASGLGSLLFRDRLRIQTPPGASTIESYLRAELGHDIRVSMYLGAARANRKPVLQLLSARGETLGFAKVGVNPLTSLLVRVERDALTRLAAAQLTSLVVPRVLHDGQWRGLDVLVLTALPVWLRRRPLPGPRLTAAIREVAAVAGLTRRPLVGSQYWQRLTGRLAAADDGADRAALLTELGKLAVRAADNVLTFGAWHGDWTPWNMASTSTGLLVWDWERFTPDVPVGFDALHLWLQGEVVSGRRQPLAAASACVDRAAGLLAPFNVTEPEARLTSLLYLVELSTRYLTDRQAETGLRLGAPGNWLIPAIVAELSRR